MKCKTSCFNPGLSRDALRRFWPLPVCSFLLFFVSLVLPFYRELHSGAAELLRRYNYVSEYGESVQNVANYFAGQFTLQTLLLAVLAPTAAMLVFHHLHGKREIQFYLSLPVRRSCLYLTSMLTGLLMVLVPMLLCHGLAAGICLYSGVVVQPALRLFAVCSLLLLLFYGMAVLSCVLAGQRFGAFLLYAGMHSAALVIWVGLSQVSERFIPGFSAAVNPPQWALWLMPLVKLFSDDVLNSLNRLKLNIPLIYGTVGILLLVFSGVLYQIRRAETAGDMLSFSAIKLISKIFAALAVGLGGFALLQLLAFPDQFVPFWGLMLLLLVLIAVGWIAAEMIIQKSFRIFHSRSVLTGGTLLLLCAAVMLGARADAFGYVHRTPELSQVESASLSISPWQGYDYTEVSPADALAIHKMLLEHTDQLGSFDSTKNSVQLSISYGLNGGTTMERTYFFNEDELPELVQATLSVLDQPENVERRLFVGWTAEPSAKTFFSGAVYSYYGDENTPTLTRNGDDSSELSAQEAITLYNAIREDIQEGNVLSPSHLLYFQDEDCPDNYGNIYLDFFTKPYDASVGSYTQYKETTPQDSANIDLFSTMTHTIAALEDMGFQFR